jgi:RNA polymerase sigma-70 factor, ECF subfamily
MPRSVKGEVDAEITSLFQRLGQGDSQASEKLLGLLYVELHQIARNCMTQQSPEHTLQATALVHEAYLKLLTSRQERWRDRAHFLALAAKAMRCVLVDHARRRNRLKRTTPGEREPLDQIVVSYEERALDLQALDGALQRLAEFDEPMARAIEMRFFGGLEMDEIADFLGMSKRTLERQWSATRAWLLKELS